MIGARILTLRQQLEPYSESATLDAQVLLAHLLGKPRAWVLAHPEAVFSGEQEGALEQALRRLQHGEPLPYVLGEWEFFGLSFQVTPVVLIPRPETELLVEQALQWLGARPKVLANASQRLCLADIGTGSGCIAVALASRLPGIQLLATDISEAALQVARHNAWRHQAADRLHFLQADLLDAIAPTSAFHLLCANLPYIPHETLTSLPIFKQEPTLATDGGADGLQWIDRLLHAARSRLAPGGLLLLEIEASSQGQSVPALARQAFPAASIRLLTDLAGRDRLVSIQLPE
jgi:release factor glutamine methyltransferase